MSERAFSVVICSDGRLPHLKAAIEALYALEYRAFELIVVCGPSRDGAREWLNTLAPAIKIADCPERNLSRARNIGIALAAGEIVAFLDDDAIPEPEWLADLAAAYDDPEVAAAGGIVYDATGRALQSRYVTVDRLGYSREREAATPEINYPFSPEFPHLLGANCSFRRTMLIELGGFDEEYEYFLDETDLLARVNDAGGRIAQCARAAVHHKTAASARRDGASVVRSWRSFIKNRAYFGLRNGAGHHSFFGVVRAALDDAETWAGEVERRVARGEFGRADQERFAREARSGLAAALSAAEAPRRLAPRPTPPPPLRPFPVRAPPGGRLGLALVTQDYPPRQNGGIARNVAELARALAGFGHHVHVFTRARGAPSLDFEEGVWVHRVEIRHFGAPPDLVPPEITPPALWDVSRTMFEEVARLDARRRVDFVYAPLWDCEPVAFLAEPRFRVVCALQTTMDFWLDSQPQWRAHPEWMRLRGRPVLALERWILARAPALHANSRAIVADIVDRYKIDLAPVRIAFAPHGLSDWAGSPAPCDPATIRFLFVGRLESRKGIDTLLEAAPGVLRRFPAARLDIVGDDTIDESKYKTAFLARADLADIASRVTFHGRVEEDALRGWYASCDALLAPSRYESFGLVYAEGMMFGKPVIGGRAGGGPEVIVEGETGFLIAPGDAEGLAEAMAALAAAPALRARMGAAGRRRYEAAFTAEIAARALLEGALAALNRPA